MTNSYCLASELAVNDHGSKAKASTIDEPIDWDRYTLQNC